MIGTWSGLLGWPGTWVTCLALSHPCWYKQVAVLCPLQPPPRWPSCEQPRQRGLLGMELSYFLVSTLQQKNNNGMLFGLAERFSCAQTSLTTIKIFSY